MRRYSQTARAVRIDRRATLMLAKSAKALKDHFPGNIDGFEQTVSTRAFEMRMRNDAVSLQYIAIRDDREFFSQIRHHSKNPGFQGTPIFAGLGEATPRRENARIHRDWNSGHRNAAPLSGLQDWGSVASSWERGRQGRSSRTETAGEFRRRIWSNSHVVFSNVWDTPHNRGLQRIPNMGGKGASIVKS